MANRTVNPPRPSDRKVSRKMLRQLADAANLSARTVFNPQHFRVHNNGLTQAISRADGWAGTGLWVAELTNSAAPYSWKEKQWDAGGSTWQDKTGGLTGTTNARHIGEISDVPSGTIVVMWQIADDTGATMYVFLYQPSIETIDCGDGTVLGAPSSPTYDAVLRHDGTNAYWEEADPNC